MNRKINMSSETEPSVTEKAADRQDRPCHQCKALSCENLACASVFFLFLVVYLTTLCRAVFWWDSGELIANIAVLGIPHRPGFPIYLLLGKLVSFIPFGSFALRINFMSALCASLSLAILYKTFQKVACFFLPETGQSRSLIQVSGLFFVLVLGFTYSFWIQAVRAEVYSLNALFFSLLFYLCMRYIESSKLGHLYLLFFLLGLGLGNHHLSLLSTIPALGLLVVRSANRSVAQWRRIPVYVVFLLLGFSIYLYLPVRAASNPLLAWGRVNSISSSAGSVFALESIKSFDLGFLFHIPANLEKLAILFSDQLTLPCFLFGLVGLLLVFRKDRRLFAFLLVLVTGNCAAVLSMATDFIPTNPDLHGYLIYSIMALALAYGMLALLLAARIRRSRPALGPVWVIAVGAVSLLPLAAHYRQANLSQNRIAHDYGMSVIAALDSNSVLFADNVNLNFILRELQYAEGTRRDVVIIDRGLLGFEWYARQKRSQLQSLFAGVSPGIWGEPLFRALLRSCLESGKSTYMEFTENDSSLVDHLRPRGYVFRVVGTEVGSLSGEDLAYQRQWDRGNPFGISPENESNRHSFERDWDAQRVFALSCFRLGLFYEWKRMPTLALEEFGRVAKVDPYDRDLWLRIKRLEQAEALSQPSPIRPPTDG
jgi:hypothetical protein